MARRKKQSFGYKIFGAATALLVAVALLLFLPKSCEETTQSEGGYEFGLELAIPQFSVDRESQVIEHVGYTVSYNTGLRNPNWVAYELTAGEVQGTEERADKFVPDPKVKGVQAVDDDYKRSGWDRGHLAPAADMKWSEQAMDESFYLSNVSPQNGNLNRGVWKSIEELVRDNATRYGKMLVVTGPVFKSAKGKGTIGKNKVVIPDAFYKVILVDNGGLKGVGFYCENVAGKKKLDTYARSIDEIEKITGIDFFHKLPDGLEDKVESGFEWKDWQ